MARRRKRSRFFSTLGKLAAGAGAGAGAVVLARRVIPKIPSLPDLFAPEGQQRLLALTRSPFVRKRGESRRERSKRAGAEARRTARAKIALPGGSGLLGGIIDLFG